MAEVAFRAMAPNRAGHPGALYWQVTVADRI